MSRSPLYILANTVTWNCTIIQYGLISTFHFAQYVEDFQISLHIMVLILWRPHITLHNMTTLLHFTPCIMISMPWPPHITTAQHDKISTLHSSHHDRIAMTSTYQSTHHPDQASTFYSTPDHELSLYSTQHTPPSKLQPIRKMLRMLWENRFLHQN